MKHLLDSEVLIISDNGGERVDNYKQWIIDKYGNTTVCEMSRNSVVSIMTGYGLDDRGVGVRVPVRPRILSSPRHPDRLWDPPNLLLNGYWGLFS
jgi:hypothetical protein